MKDQKLSTTIITKEILLQFSRLKGKCITKSYTLSLLVSEEDLCLSLDKFSEICLLPRLNNIELFTDPYYIIHNEGNIYTESLDSIICKVEMLEIGQSAVYLIRAFIQPNTVQEGNQIMKLSETIATLCRTTEEIHYSIKELVKLFRNFKI